MRSFAFSSIQDQSAELGGPGGGEDSSVHPSIHATVQSGGWGVVGGNVTALKLKDRRRDATASLLPFRVVLLPSSLQPHLVLRGGGGCWFGYSLCLWGFFWFGVYFWYPFREGVTPAVGSGSWCAPPPPSGRGIAARFRK